MSTILRDTLLASPSQAMVSGDSMRTEFEFSPPLSSGLPLVYMAVVVPIGFLVNTDDIGNHYGVYDTANGELLAYVISSNYM